jgi:hypothetical protein
VAQSHGHTTTFPASGHPVSALLTNRGWSLSKTAPIVTQYPNLQPGTFEAFIQSLPAWEIQLLDQVIIHCDLDTLHHSLQTGPGCIGVSDESVQGNWGAFG